MAGDRRESEPDPRHRTRNRALFSVLLGVAVLFYFLTIVRMGGG